MTSNKTDDSADMTADEPLEAPLEEAMRAVEFTSMPSKADKRGDALRANLQKRKAFIKSQKKDKI